MIKHGYFEDGERELPKKKNLLTKCNQNTYIQCKQNIYNCRRSNIEEHYNLLERNSKRGIAILAVAEMWVNLTIRTGSAFMMMSGISTLQTESATTHWFAQR